MKKLILTLTTIFTLAIAAIGFAADGGDLNKEQRAAENFVAAFTLEAPAYNQFINGFDDTLKAKVTEQAYDVLKKQVQERFGRLKESKFYSFQRYDNVDYVTYIGSFSKEKLVSITFAFNKENKMTDFALSPMQQNAEQK